MPVKKTKIEKNKSNLSSEKFNLSCMKNEFGKKIMFTLLGIMVVYIIVLLGTMIRNNMQEYIYIGQADKMERTIYIDATAKVVAKPDIAVTTMGMVNEGKTVQEAQTANNGVMSKLTEKLKEMGVEDKDIQTTNYNIYPLYNYTENGRVLRGYEVRQDVTVKIRDLEKANEVLSLAGELGANNISGLQFIIDDPEVYKNEAREEALKKLAEKAQTLSKLLGVRFGKVVSYNEYSGDNTPYYNVMKSSAMYDLAGGVVNESISSVESGSTEVNMTVSITLQIR
ncbi:MAG: SIMPL domain-containing protein [Candidatus Magasanikbacteria bacterium]|nr:SIMPL domain-containing protein [Candidatus Magasanikbacteria bacterium]